MTEFQNQMLFTVNKTTITILCRLLKHNFMNRFIYSTSWLKTNMVINLPWTRGWKARFSFLAFIQDNPWKLINIKKSHKCIDKTSKWDLWAVQVPCCLINSFQSHLLFQGHSCVKFDLGWAVQIFQDETLQSLVRELYPDRNYCMGWIIGVG